jgi:predicted Zn-dependent peptidase
MFKKNSIKLKNGLPVIWDYRPSYQSVAITCIVGVGSRNDYSNNKGLAHCVEHMIFESQKQEGAKPIFHSIMDSGGYFDAWVGIDTTTYFAYMHKDDALEGLQSLAELLKSVPADKKLLEKQKEIIRHEMDVFGQDNKYNWQRIKFQLMGASESLRHPSIGTSKDLKRIKVEHIQSLHKQFYTTNNMVLSIVGNLDVKVLLPKIESLFKDFSDGTKNETEEIELANGPRCYFNRLPPICEVSLFFGVSDLSNKNLVALEFLFDFFSNMPHSRLLDRLREKDALVYNIEANSNLFHEFITLDIFVKTQPRNITKLIKGILEEGKKVCSEELTPFELEGLKQRLIKWRMLEFESPSFASDWYATNHFFAELNLAQSIQRWVDNINDIKTEDLVQVAREVFHPQNVFAYISGRIGPWRRYRIKRHMRKIL